MTFGNTTGTVELCSEAAAEAMTTPTILRIRGNLTVGSTVGAQTEEFHRYVLGIIVWPSNTGIFPDLATQDGLESPWLWLWQGVQGNLAKGEIRFNSTGVLQGTEMTRQEIYENIQVDVKARRRIRQGEVLVLVGKTIDFTGAADTVVTGIIRTLIQE